MSNLRRLRCYLLASQGHHFAYEKHLEELVPKDVARALADNPVTIPDAQSIYLGIDSLAMNVRPFDEINQFRTRCFISFASHQKRDLSLTQVGFFPLPMPFDKKTHMHNPKKWAGPEAVRGGVSDQEHLEAAVDFCLPGHLATDHQGRGNVCGTGAVCGAAVSGDFEVELAVLMRSGNACLKRNPQSLYSKQTLNFGNAVRLKKKDVA